MMEDRSVYNMNMYHESQQVRTFTSEHQPAFGCSCVTCHTFRAGRQVCRSPHSSTDRYSSSLTRFLVLNNKKHHLKTTVIAGLETSNVLH